MGTGTGTGAGKGVAAAEHVAYATVCVVCVLCLSSCLLSVCACVFLFASAAFDAVRSQRAN